MRSRRSIREPRVAAAERRTMGGKQRESTMRVTFIHQRAATCVTTTNERTTATNYERADPACGHGAVFAFLTAVVAVHDKPMVPTAPTSLDEPALPSRRRHIGQPFGRGGHFG